LFCDAQTSVHFRPLTSNIHQMQIHSPSVLNSTRLIQTAPGYTREELPF